MPGCGFAGGAKWPDSTVASIRVKNGNAELIVCATSLLKTMWLQVAEIVVGKRALKKCAAKDCGKYLNLAGAVRPGAYLFHPHCMERLKKQRSRGKENEACRLHDEGLTPKEIAVRLNPRPLTKIGSPETKLKVQIKIVEGWLEKKGRLSI